MSDDPAHPGYSAQLASPGSAGDGDARAGSRAVRVVATGLSAVGERAIAILDHIGATWVLLTEVLRWMYRAIVRRKVRLGLPAIASQMVRVGAKSVFIVSLVSGCVGLILVLQMAPPLDQFGQKQLVANIVGVAVLRELGPLIAAIVLTGFAGASIAAELGTMVVGEEIEALEAQALNPVRFLVVPRVVATVVAMTVLAVFSNVVAIGCGLLIAALALDISPSAYMDNLLSQAKPIDFYTGIAKSVIFGLLIGLIACVNGLRVTGGAAGVGNATTKTVVQSVVAIVVADLIFTAIFFAWKLN
jgi:phospholipid/cholesterol/gamma-HCH transport system permease protein